MAWPGSAWCLGVFNEDSLDGTNDYDPCIHFVYMYNIYVLSKSIGRSTSICVSINIVYVYVYVYVYVCVSCILSKEV